MPPTTPKRIMISSVMKGFSDVRDAITTVIIKSDNLPKKAEDVLSDKPPVKAIQELVENCDCYIGIFHQGWGWVPPDDNSEKLSVTALEYTLAKKLGKPVAIFVSTLEKEKELQEFLDKIGDYYAGEWRISYKNILELVGDVGLSIQPLISKISNKEKNIKDIKKELTEYAQKKIDQIKDNIHSIYEKPNDLDEIFTKMEGENLWIIGERGIGKSVILKKITQKELESHKNILLIRSEDLLLKETFLDATQNELGLSVNEIISKLTEKEESLLLMIDSVDALPRNPKVWSSFSSEILIILKNPKVRTILTIRKSDYVAFPQFFSQDWGSKVFLKGLTDKQIERILENIGLKGQINKNLFSILKQPFYLDILDILVKSKKFKDVSSLSTQSQFLKAHYDIIVRNSEKWQDLASKRVELLFQITEKMLNVKRLKIPNFRFAATPEFDSLRTDGIVLDNEGFIQFFHQVYFDFIMSMKIIEGGLISQYLAKIGNETFLRSTIQFTLAYLHEQDFENYLQNIQDLLTSGKDDYWKTVTIGFIAQLNSIQEKERTIVEGLLNNDSDLQKYFFDSVIEQKNPYWYSIWKDTLFDQWSSSDEFKHAILLTDYITKSVGWLS